MGIAEQIADLSKMGLSQTDIAIKAGASLRSVSRWATGKVRASPLAQAAVQELHQKLTAARRAR